MKLFPLSPRPFGGRVVLNERQCAEFERLTENLVAATLLEFDAFVQANRVMDKREWKPIKAREHVTVYKKTTPCVHKPSSAAQWRMPKLVAVGTIAGTLDDMMYGVVTPDAQAIRVKTAYVEDELLDGMVLCPIRRATPDDPFRFVHVKWLAMGHPRVMNAIVRPRDFVYVESTGIKTLPDGSRVGYHAIHAVELPQCPELTELSIIRARLCNCYTYRETTPRVVEVYMTTYSDPGGTPPEKIATMSAANTLIGIWKAMWCAQNKKLAWHITNTTAKQRVRTCSQAAQLVRTESVDKCACVICSKRLSSRRPMITCQLCAAWVCARCCVKRKLTAATKKLELLQRVAEVCKCCMAYVDSLDTLQIARAQYVTPPVPVSRSNSSNTGTSGVVRDVVLRVNEFDSARTVYFSPSVSGSPRDSVISTGSSERESEAIESIEDWGRRNRARSAKTLDLDDTTDDPKSTGLTHRMESLGIEKALTATEIDELAICVGDVVIEF